MSLAPPGFADSPLAGIDFSWLAVDEDGHVAWLVTSGSAAVPKWVEERSDDFGGLEDSLARLPELGGCIARETPGNIEHWRAAARSGVFAYDWVIYGGPYSVVAAPVTPLKVEALPPDLANLARRTRFTGLCFHERPALGVRDVLACGHGALRQALRSQCNEDTALRPDELSRRTMQLVGHPMSSSVQVELERARSELALSSSDFSPLPEAEARAVVEQMLEAFVREPSARWWWEHLKLPALSACFHDGKPFERLTRILPPGPEKAWLIAEPDETPLAVYSASARAIERALGECAAFEYYVVGPGMTWLVCENHHGVLKAVGAEVESRLRSLLDAHADQVEWSAHS